NSFPFSQLVPKRIPKMLEKFTGRCPLGKADAADYKRRLAYIAAKPYRSIRIVEGYLLRIAAEALSIAIPRTNCTSEYYSRGKFHGRGFVTSSSTCRFRHL